MTSTSFYIFFIVSLLFSSTSAFWFGDEGLEDFHLDQLSKYIHFSYSGLTGPSLWGILDPSFKKCAIGKEQSPVNIQVKDSLPNANLKPLIAQYDPVGQASVLNSGHVIGLKYEGKLGGITIDGKQYLFKQLHFHTPSEHTIDGKRFAAEMHLVHAADENSIAVVGILLAEGEPDPLLTKLESVLKDLPKKHGEHGENILPFGKLETSLMTGNLNTKYYRYKGSLTTPPCTEGVIWSVLTPTRTISKEQIELLKAPLSSDFRQNARPVQNLKDRKIERQP